MSALVRKETRLLLPAWIAAMLLVMAPIPLGKVLGQDSASDVTFGLTVCGVAIACLMLGLTGFGREMSSHTFSLLLAQPRARREFWRAKVVVLLLSVIPLALFLGLVSRRFVPSPERWETVLIWFVSACVAVTGGLWTTLLFRQIIASFWISLLVPFAILASIMNVSEEALSEDTRALIGIVLLLAYSVAGYLFARWQFLHAQDTAWTGGNLALPQLDRWLPWKRTVSAPRQLHPLRALLGKELQFQQINFLLAGILLLVQLTALLVQKVANTSEHSVLDMIVQNFWGIWVIMPLLVGCGAVAEERKLGTLESQLCLPVSRASQFAIKVVATLVCGVVLGAVVPVGLSFTHATGVTRGGDFVMGWTVVCAGLALVSLYASSLTNQILQAFVAAIGIIVAGMLLGNWFAGTFSRGRDEFSLFGLMLWRGPLVLFVGAGVMLLVAVVLSWRRLRWFWISLLIIVAVLLGLGKFQSLAGAISTADSNAHVFGVRMIVVVATGLALGPVALTLALAAMNFTSLSLWRRNLAVWLGCLVITGIITTLIYNRVWEVVMRFEPPAGPPRLSGSVQATITPTFIGRPTVVLLSDGRLCSYNGYERIPSPVTQSQTNQAAAHEPAWRVVERPSIEFIGGSNWVTIATTGREIVGLKSDGSLWSAHFYEQVDQAGNVIPVHTGTPTQKGFKLRATGLKFDRLNTETNWASVAAGWQHCVALKQDGTIWGWGDNSNRQLGDGPSAISNGLAQIVTESNWIAVFASSQHTFAVNRAGDIWKWGRFTTDVWGSETEQGPVKLNLKVAGVRHVASENNFDLILDTDGNLWGLGRIPPSLIGGRTFQIQKAPKKLSGENWSIVDLKWQGFAGLRNNGTLWNQPVSQFLEGRSLQPVQLGERTDWVAVSKDWDSVLAIATDGTIYRFGQPTLGPDLDLLAPTRRVTWSLNLLGAVP